MTCAGCVRLSVTMPTLVDALAVALNGAQCPFGHDCELLVEQAPGDVTVTRRHLTTSSAGQDPCPLCWSREPAPQYAVGQWGLLSLAGHATVASVTHTRPCCLGRDLVLVLARALADVEHARVSIPALGHPRVTWTTDRP